MVHISQSSTPTILVMSLAIEDDVVVFVVVVDQRNGAGGRQVLLHPRGDFFYFGIIVRFRAVVAFGPAADLAFEISLRLAEIGEARGGVIHAMQADEIIDEGFAEPARFFRRENPNRAGDFCEG